MKFKITYIDPKTDLEKTEIKEFEDTLGAEIKNSDGVLIGVTNITAREWANDYAYAMSDKGWYTVVELWNTEAWKTGIKRVTRY